MASCIKNIPAKNYQNLIIGFQVTVENVGDVFFETVYSHMRMRNSQTYLLGLSQNQMSRGTTLVNLATD